MENRVIPIKPKNSDGKRWGLPLEAVEGLGERLRDVWYRFRDCFKSQTRDTSEYAYEYLRGQRRMEKGRNFANIGREVGVSGQNLQHFMSQSPWSAHAVYRQVQEEIKRTVGLEEGGALLLDESAEEKAGTGSAGAARQYNGRLGKVEMSQVGVFLAYANLKASRPVWSGVEGELFLPEGWFEEEQAPLRRRLGIPEERTFQTKIALGWEMIQRVQANGLPFEIVAFDGLYGQSGGLRAQWRGADLTYMGEVPRDTQVYLQKPVLGIAERTSRRGRPPSRVQVLSDAAPVSVETLRQAPETGWQMVRVRPNAESWAIGSLRAGCGPSMREKTSGQNRVISLSIRNLM